MSPQARETKAQINKRLYQTKNLLLNKGRYHKNKRSPTEWEKLFINNISEKESISKIYKELMQLNIKKTKQPDLKILRKPEKTFFQRRHIDVQQAHLKNAQYHLSSGKCKRQPDICHSDCCQKTTNN